MTLPLTINALIATRGLFIFSSHRPPWLLRMPTKDAISPKRVHVLVTSIPLDSQRVSPVRLWPSAIAPLLEDRRDLSLGGCCAFFRAEPSFGHSREHSRDHEGGEYFL
jgi:hypothetical protein